MNNLLDTFLILFDSDASEVKKGAQEAGIAQTDLQKKINSTDSSATKLGANFLTVAKAAAVAVAAIVSVGSITRAVMAQADYADHLGEVADSLGQNIETLDAWGGAAKIAGGSAEAFNGTVKTLAGSLAQMDAVGRSRAAPFFEELGIKMLDAAGKARPVMELLPEIATAFEGMSKEASLGFGRKMGLDEGTIMLLQRGRREVEALVARQRELGVITKEDSEIASKYNDTLDDFARVMGGVWRGIANTVLPILTNFFESLTDLGIWFRENKEMIGDFFGSIAVVLTVAFLPALVATTAQMFRLAAATVVATAPFWLIVAAVLAVGAAFTLIRDDIRNFMDGNLSVIGVLLEGWQNFSRDVNIAITELWTQVGEAFQAGVDNIIGLFTGMADIIMAIWNTISETITGVIDGVMSGVQSAKDFLGLGSDDTTHEAIMKGQYSLSTAGSAPLNGMTSNSITNSGIGQQNKTNNIKIDKVTVETQATDAAGVALGFSQGLNSQMRQATANYDDGVAM